jgi:uncharacterized membrane protein YfhO
MSYNKLTIVNEIDRKAFLTFLHEFYETTDFEELQLKLRNDLKHKSKLEKMCELSGYSAEEFLYYAISLFDKIFNKLMIKKLKEHVNGKKPRKTRRNKS